MTLRHTLVAFLALTALGSSAFSQKATLESLAQALEMIEFTTFDCPPMEEETALCGTTPYPGEFFSLALIGALREVDSGIRALSFKPEGHRFKTIYETGSGRLWVHYEQGYVWVYLYQ